MKKSKILLPLTLAFVATASGAIAASNVKAAAEDTFKMVEGSSIQLRENQTENMYGIKFAAEVGTPVEGATYNLMIVPVTYVDAYEKIDGAKKDLAEFMLDVKAANPTMPLAIATDLEVENGRIEGSIVDIRWENLTEQFVGAAYYTLADGTVKCAALATDGKRSIVDVATKALQSGDYAANETVTGVLKGFVYNAIQEKNKISFEDKDVAGNEAKIVFAEATKSVYVGDTITVNYTPYVAADMATWSSTVESVATVDNGVITAKAEGTTTINVSLLDLTASYTLEVKKPTIENAKVTGATVTWDAIDGASYVVTLNGEAQPAQTENSFTLTQDGVYDISVAATKNDVTGEATVVAEDYMYTVDDISLANMKDVSYTSLNHNSGKITFTSDGIGSRKDSGIQLNKAYTNEFIKVTFEATGASMAENGIGLGLRGINSVSTVYDPLYTGGWALYPEGGNGGYFSTCYSDTAGNFHHAIDYLSGALGAVFETLNSGISLTSGFEKEVDYSYIYGAIGSGENTSVYFGIYKGDTLLNLYKWDWAKLYAKYTGVSNGTAYNYSSFPQIRDSGAFHIWSRNESARTLSYEIIEDATSILSAYDKPSIEVDGNTVEWNTVGWAEGYEVSFDNGEWKKQSENSYLVSSYGSHTISVRAYKGEVVSDVATKEFVYSSENVEIYNATNVKFTQTEAGKAKVSLTSPGVYRTGESKVILKNQYKDEFIKVGFTIDSDNFNLAGNLGLSVGLRENSVNTDPVATKNHSIRYFNFGTAGYAAFCYGDNNLYSNHGAGKHETTSNKSVDLYKMPAGSYYMVCGMIKDAEGKTSVHYFLLDATETILMEVVWDFDGAVADNDFGSIPESGWFSIYSWDATTEFTYELITAEEAFDCGIAMNMATKTVAKNGDVRTITFTNTSTVKTSSQQWPTALYGGRQQYTDAFVKVGFTPVSDNLQNNLLYIQIRAGALNADGGAVWTIWPYDNGSNTYIGYRYGSTGNNFIYLCASRTPLSTAEGAYYYMTAGIKTAADGTETMYFFLTSYDKTTGTETLIAKNSKTVASTSQGTIPASGYFGVQSNYSEGRTITYQVLTDETAMNRYINATANSVINN